MAVPYGFDYPVTEELHEKVAEVLRKRIHHSGAYTREAEKKIARAFGCDYGAAVNTGSSACLIILKALKVGVGDEVLIPATSYVAPAEATMLCGAKPIFVECESKTLNIDPEAAEASITDRTRGMIVVHQYGHPVDLDAFVSIAKRHDIWLVENCCHAFGARYKGRPVGSFGLVGFTSISRKHLSVCGTGGIAFTNNEELARKLAMLSVHGRKAYDATESFDIGYNFRLNEIQACIACEQLKQVDEWIATRRRNADRYNRLFNELDLPIELPIPKDEVFHSSLHYVIQTDDRDALRAYLAKHDIGTNIQYETPCHLHSIFQDLLGTRPGQLPVSERACQRILTLPATPNINDDQIGEVVDRISLYFKEKARG